MKIHMVSLGCPKNLVDSERILGTLGAAGAEVTAMSEDSDVIILSTCGFISPAMEETEHEIEKALRTARNGKKVYVIGCAVNRHGDYLKKKFPGVADWFTIEAAPELTKTLAPDIRPDGETRMPTTAGFAYLKISDGCSNRCSYCTIPSIRGPYRSFEMDRLIVEADQLAHLGYRELILIGQDTTRYGMDLYGRPMLAALLARLSEIESIEWIRIMYAHPRTLDDGVIEAIDKNEKICPYIDLPIQHINSRILKSMNRGVDRKRIEDLVRTIMTGRDITLRTTVIAGYPTETEEEFAELMEFLGRGYFEWLGVFPYYNEAGTPAAELPQLDEEIITERYEKVLALQQRLLREKNQRRRGTVHRTLIHGREENFIGHAAFCAPEIDSRIVVNGSGLKMGSIYPVRITAARGCDLEGELCPTEKGEPQ